MKGNTEDKLQTFCLCGCGELTSPGKKYIKGHNTRIKNPMDNINSREKVSSSLKCKYESGYVNPRKGKHPSIEHIKKVKKTWKNKYVNGYINPRTGIQHTEETKRKIGLANKGKKHPNVIPWNKGLTKETSEKIRIYSRKLIGHAQPTKNKKWSEVYDEEKSRERSRKISLAQKGKKRDYVKGDKNPAKRPDVRKKISNKKKEWYKDPKNKEKIEQMYTNFQSTPNSPEQKIIELLSQWYPGEFIYTGHGKYLTINGKRPDFQHIYLPMIIEHCGAWHSIEETKERVENFREQGHETLIIWNKEFRKPGGISILKNRTEKLLKILR